MGRRAVFFDRDGVVNRDTGYTFKPSDLVLFDDLAPALTNLKEMGFLLIVVTNQSGVARGLFNLYDVFSFHQAIQFELQKKQAPIFDAFYICPHLESGIVFPYGEACECRKPKAGMIRDACRDFSIDVKQSVLIGDRSSDIEAGRSAGVFTAFLDREKRSRESHGADITSASIVDILCSVKKMFS